MLRSSEMDIAIAVASLFAAGLWARSAFVRIPAMYVAGTHLGRRWPEGEPQPETAQSVALRRQAKYSAWAAGFATAAALLQAYKAVVMPSI